MKRGRRRRRERRLTEHARVYDRVKEARRVRRPRAARRAATLGRRAATRYRHLARSRPPDSRCPAQMCPGRRVPWGTGLPQVASDHHDTTRGYPFRLESAQLVLQPPHLLIAERVKRCRCPWLPHHEPAHRVLDGCRLLCRSWRQLSAVIPRDGGAAACERACVRVMDATRCTYAALSDRL